jgi:hypothetical protein
MHGSNDSVTNGFDIQDSVFTAVGGGWSTLNCSNLPTNGVVIVTRTHDRLFLECGGRAKRERSGDTAFSIAIVAKTPKAVSPLRSATALQSAFGWFASSVALCRPFWGLPVSSRRLLRG